MSWVGSISAYRASRPQAKHTDSTTRGQADQGLACCALRGYTALMSGCWTASARVPKHWDTRAELSNRVA